MARQNRRHSASNPRGYGKPGAYCDGRLAHDIVEAAHVLAREARQSVVRKESEERREARRVAVMLITLPPTPWD